MFEKKPKPQGKYLSPDPAETLRRRNAIKLSLQAAALLAFVLPVLFAKQRFLVTLTGATNIAGATAYAAGSIFAAVWLAVVFALSFGRYAIRPAVPAADKPKNGFEKHVWAAIEWQCYIAVIAAVMQIALTAWQFSLPSLVVALCWTAAAACEYYALKLCRDSYVGKTTFLSLESELAEPAADSGDEPDAKSNAEPDSDLPDADPDVEDFYDE